MILLGSEAVSSSTEESTEDADRSLTLEETVVQWTITVLVPFLITFIAFGVIIYAFSEWKLY